MVHINFVYCSNVNRGKDFRKSFSDIGGLRALTGRVPFIALTASATVDTQHKIVSSLNMNSPVVISRNLDRVNIFLSVARASSICVSRMMCIDLSFHVVSKNYMPLCNFRGILLTCSLFFPLSLSHNNYQRQLYFVRQRMLLLIFTKFCVPHRHKNM